MVLLWLKMGAKGSRKVDLEHRSKNLVDGVSERDWAMAGWGATVFLLWLVGKEWFFKGMREQTEDLHGEVVGARGSP